MITCQFENKLEYINFASINPTYQSKLRDCNSRCIFYQSDFHVPGEVMRKHRCQDMMLYGLPFQMTKLTRHVTVKIISGFGTLKTIAKNFRKILLAWTSYRLHHFDPSRIWVQHTGNLTAEYLATELISFPVFYQNSR